MSVCVICRSEWGVGWQTSLSCRDQGSAPRMLCKPVHPHTLDLAWPACRCMVEACDSFPPQSRRPFWQRCVRTHTASCGPPAGCRTLVGKNPAYTPQRVNFVFSFCSRTADQHDLAKQAQWRIDSKRNAAHGALVLRSSNSLWLADACRCLPFTVCTLEMSKQNTLLLPPCALCSSTGWGMTST